MKKLILISSVACLTIFATVFNSCKKSNITEAVKTADPVTSEISSSNITVNSGILNFATNQALKNTFAELRQAPTTELLAWRNSFAGFKSLEDEYIQRDVNAELGTGISADSSRVSKLLPDVPDEIFASVLNKDGIIIVENIIYKLNANDFWTTSIANLNNGVINWTNKTQRHYNDRSLSNLLPSMKKIFTDDNGVAWPKSNNKTVRMTHTMWCYAVPPIYASAAAKVKMERSGTFGWVNINHTKSVFNPLQGEISSNDVLNGITLNFRNYNASNNVLATKTNANMHTLFLEDNQLQVIWMKFTTGTFKSTVTMTYAGKNKTDVRSF